jgi:hypothetical protein
MRPAIESKSGTQPSGEAPLQSRIQVKWQELLTVMTPDGDDAQTHLGLPRGEETPILVSQGGGVFQDYARGMIVERGDGRTFVIYGAIYDHYVKIGGTAGTIGLPTSDEKGVSHGGRVSNFDRGDIYWRADVGARDVRGSRRARHAMREDPCTLTLIDRGLAVLGRVGTRLGLLPR